MFVGRGRNDGSRRGGPFARCCMAVPSPGRNRRRDVCCRPGARKCRRSPGGSAVRGRRVSFSSGCERGSTDCAGLAVVAGPSHVLGHIDRWNPGRGRGWARWRWCGPFNARVVSASRWKRFTFCCWRRRARVVMRRNGRRAAFVIQRLAETGARLANRVRRCGLGQTRRDPDLRRAGGITP